MTVELSEPQDRLLTMVCWAINAPQLPRIEMAVLINGKPLKIISLKSFRGATYGLQVPASYWRRGKNRLSFRYSHTVQPAEVRVGTNDRRRLAAAWSLLRISELADLQRLPPSSLIGSNNHSLMVPLSTELSFNLELSPGAALVLKGLKAYGDSSPENPCRLQVTLDSPTRNAPLVMKIKPFSPEEGAKRVPLITSWQQRVKLRLSVTPPAEQAPTQELQLELIRPEVVNATLAQPEQSSGERATQLAGESLPNVIIYLIDALRADHLGCYGYSRPTSPNIDSFAKDCLQFPNTMAQSSWTKPAVASLLTGLYPEIHKVHHNRSALPQEVVTIAEILLDAGYETSAVVANGVVSGRFGFRQGFKSFDYLPESEAPQIHHLSDRVNEAAFKWLEQRDTSRPFLLHLHSLDPHSPYTPPERFRQQLAGFVSDPVLGLQAHVLGLDKREDEIPDAEVEALTALYDAEIAFNDFNFGVFIERLKALDLYDSSLIILLGDHGEEFYDHGRWRHGYTLFQEQLRVPLLIKLPQQELAGQQPATIARQIDVLPTILDLLGLPCPEAVQGRSLISATDSEGSLPSFAWLGPKSNTFLKTVSVDNLKLIEYLEYGRPHPQYQLFDLTSDPGESQSIAESHPEDVSRLLALVNQSKQADQELGSTSVALDRKMTERLRALGYIE